MAIKRTKGVDGPSAEGAVMSMELKSAPEAADRTAMCAPDAIASVLPSGDADMRWAGRGVPADISVEVVMVVGKKARKDGNAVRALENVKSLM